MKKVLLLAFIVIVISLYLDNIWISKFSVLLELFICFYQGYKEKIIMNPYYLFAICPFSLLIYVNFGSAYMVDLTNDTVILGSLNILFFLIALIYTPSIKKRVSYFNIISKHNLKIQSVLFYLMGFSARIIPPLASILWIFSVPAIVCALKTREKKMMVFVLFMFCSTIILGNVSKTTMLLYSLSVIICIEKYYIKSKIDRRKLIMACAGAVVFMVFSFTFANKERGHSDADANIEYYSNQGLEWNYASSLFMPYMYLTNGWTNLQFITETRSDRTYGLWLVKPLLGYLKLRDGVEDSYEIESYSSFNTPTYIACGYLDFGYWGSIITSIFLGIFVKFIYSNFRNSTSPLDVASYILVALGTFQMFFSNHFLMHSYPITCVIFMEIYKYCVIRKRVVEN